MWDRVVIAKLMWGSSRSSCWFHRFMICPLPYPSCELPRILQEHVSLYVSKNSLVHLSLMKKTKCVCRRGWGLKYREEHWGLGQIKNFRSVRVWVKIPLFLCFNSCYCWLEINKLLTICLLHCWFHFHWLNAACACMIWVLLWGVLLHEDWDLRVNAPSWN